MAARDDEYDYLFKGLYDYLYFTVLSMIFQLPLFINLLQNHLTTFIVISLTFVVNFSMIKCTVIQST